MAISIWWTDFSQELRMFPRVTPSELDLEQPGQSHSRTTEPLDLDLTSSIRKEVGRLMQEQNKRFPQTLSLVGNAKKKTVRKAKLWKADTHTCTHVLKFNLLIHPLHRHPRAPLCFVPACCLKGSFLSLHPEAGSGTARQLGRWAKLLHPKPPPQQTNPQKNKNKIAVVLQVTVVPDLLSNMFVL